MQLGYTYKLTFYQSSGNPWGSSYPSWTMETINTPIPMKNNVDLYVINTNGYNTINGTLLLPTSLVNGQTFRFLDVGGKMGTTRIVISSTNNVKILGGNYFVFGYDNVKMLFCRVGDNGLQL